MASRIINSCLSEPRRFRITPAISISLSYSLNPKAVAAMLSPTALQSRTKTTGALNFFAISAVLLIPLAPPSKSPITPSIIEMSAPSESVANVGTKRSGGVIHVSKL